MLLPSGRANTGCSFVGLIPPVFKRSAGWRQERVCGAQRLQVQIRGYRGLARQQRPHARDLSPRKRPQNAPHLSETRKGWFVSEYVVGLEGLEPPSKPLLRTSPAQTGLFFVKQMGRLAQANIPVFLLYGNHDAESQITRKLTLPANVSVFSARKAETFRLQQFNVVLHGQNSGNGTSRTISCPRIRRRLPAASTSVSFTPAWAGLEDTRTMRPAPSKT